MARTPRRVRSLATPCTSIRPSPPPVYSASDAAGHEQHGVAAHRSRGEGRRPRHEVRRGVHEVARGHVVDVGDPAAPIPTRAAPRTATPPSRTPCRRLARPAAPRPARAPRTTHAPTPRRQVGQRVQGQRRPGDVRSPVPTSTVAARESPAGTGSLGGRRPERPAGAVAAGQDERRQVAGGGPGEQATDHVPRDAPRRAPRPGPPDRSELDHDPCCRPVTSASGARRLTASYDAARRPNRRRLSAPAARLAAERFVPRCEQGDDPVEVLDAGELDAEPPLAPPQGDLHPGVEAVGQPLRPGRPGRACRRAGARTLRCARRARRPRRAPRPPRRLAPTGPRRRCAGARRSIAAPSSRPSRARAWPADSTPAATRRCTSGGSFSSRSVLEICGRERPIRCASSSCVQPKSSSSWLYAAASSSGLSWLRCRFSSSASRSRSSSAVSRTMAGTALQAGGLAGAPPPLTHDELVAVRRSRHRAAPRPAAAPRSRARECTSSAMSSSSKTVRGCLGFGADWCDRDLGEVRAGHRHELPRPGVSREPPSPFHVKPVAGTPAAVGAAAASVAAGLGGRVVPRSSASAAEPRPDRGRRRRPARWRRAGRRRDQRPQAAPEAPSLLAHAPAPSR